MTLNQDTFDLLRENIVFTILKPDMSPLTRLEQVTAKLQCEFLLLGLNE